MIGALYVPLWASGLAIWLGLLLVVMLIERTERRRKDACKDSAQQ